LAAAFKQKACAFGPAAAVSEAEIAAFSQAEGGENYIQKKRKTRKNFCGIFMPEGGPVMRLPDDAMWKATVDCDGSYDGAFFYGVKTVGVYCRPSCKSRTPLRKNVRFFRTGKDAQDAGFRPCKRCRPDVADYAPVLEIARRTKKLIDNYYAQRKRLNAEIGKLGVTHNHLAVIFRKHYGMPPGRYVNRLRADQAKRLLAETAMPLIDIAGAIAFDSLSAFYSFFKKHAGTTPKKYRVHTQGKKQEVEP
jgi:AraC family transcriptional regulator of adaptative response / methylphosphotriester-DNA alkyltransferase methyltransferase